MIVHDLSLVALPPLFLLPGVALPVPDHAIGVEKAELLSAQESHWHDVLFPSLVDDEEHLRSITLSLFPNTLTNYQGWSLPGGDVCIIPTMYGDMRSWATLDYGKIAPFPLLLANYGVVKVKLPEETSNGKVMLPCSIS